MRLTDPLQNDYSEIEVTDVASAMYVLKNTNDLFFGVKYMQANAEKEYKRNADEVFNLELELVEPYLATDTSVASDGSIFRRRLTYIPKPLPDVVPDNVKAAVEQLDAQLALNKTRIDAELEEDTAALISNRQSLERKVNAWFKAEVERRAGWLNGADSCTLSGSTLKYGKNISYKELNYD